MTAQRDIADIHRELQRWIDNRDRLRAQRALLPKRPELLEALAEGAVIEGELHLMGARYPVWIPGHQAAEAIAMQEEYVERKILEATRALARECEDLESKRKSADRARARKAAERRPVGLTKTAKVRR